MLVVSTITAQCMYSTLNPAKIELRYLPLETILLPSIFFPDLNFNKINGVQ